MDVGIQNAAGEDVIDIRLSRNRDGLLVRVKVRPEVEEFFQRWGGGRIEDVREFGRMWQGVGGAQLSIWMVGGKAASPQFTFNRPGDNFIMEQPKKPQARGLEMEAAGLRQLEEQIDGSTNISLLQLAGASKGDGVSFTIEAALSKTELNKIAERLRIAAAQFYTDYIKPVNIQVAVVARNVGG